MAYDGNGTFTPLYNWQTDKANGIKIRADRMDGQDGDIATGLSTCVTKDGQTTITANLPMATFRFTGVGNASARDEYASAGQIQDQGLTYFTAGGTIDAYTLTPSPAITALVAGLTFFVRIPDGKDSVTSTPTLNISGLGAATIANGDLTALGTAALVGGGVYAITYQGTAGFLIPNRQSVPASSGMTLAALQTAAFTAAVNTRYPCLFAASGTIQGPASASVGDELEFALADNTINYLWKPVLNSNGATTPYYLPSNNTIKQTYSGTVQGWV